MGNEYRILRQKLIGLQLIGPQSEPKANLWVDYIYGPWEVADSYLSKEDAEAKLKEYREKYNDYWFKFMLVLQPWQP